MKTYTIKTPSGSYESHFAPINTDTPKVWADSIIKKGLAAVAHGLGKTVTGSVYTLDNFLADTLIGDMPYEIDEYHAVAREIARHSDYATMEEAFENRFNCVFLRHLVEAHQQQ